jgi:enoyl-CoA hydratase/carnithine racemase
LSDVRYEVRDRVAEITLDRPPVNALAVSTVAAVNDALRRATADDGVRAVILHSASQKVFCAGLDIDLLRGASSSGMRQFLDRLYVELAEVQYRLGKPSIAAVAGAARAGGMTLAVSCDMIVAGSSATFGYPEIEIGILPAIHFALLPRIVGRHRAFELLFGAAPIDAARAAELGLVNRVVAADAVLGEARALAARMAARPPAVMRVGRNAFHRASALDLARTIEDLEDTLCATVDLAEAREGIAAFLEKRPPRW